MTENERQFEFLREIKKAYDSLRSRNESWPELQLVAVTARKEREALSGDDLWIEALNHTKNESCHAWVRYRSEAIGWTPGTRNDLPARTEAGPPLFGEWLESDQVSIHLRPDPDHGGCFAFWRYDDRADPQSLAGAEIAALRQEIFVLKPPLPRQLDRGAKKLPVLRYYVYWGLNDAEPGALRRMFYRFAGFDERADCIVDTRMRPKYPMLETAP